MKKLILILAMFVSVGLMANPDTTYTKIDSTSLIVRIGQDSTNYQYMIFLKDEIVGEYERLTQTIKDLGDRKKFLKTVKKKLKK